MGVFLIVVLILGKCSYVFISKIVSSAYGQYGNVDFEIRIPSRLSALALPEGSVKFYTELS